MLIDTHAHIYDEQYGDGGKAIIADMEADGLGAVITVGCDEQTSRICVELAENNKNVYATVGVHPYYPETVTDRCIASLRALAKSEKVVAVGEFGFDYHHDVFDKAAQMRAAVMQYELARELKLPVVFHVREAAGDFYAFSKDRAFPESGVMHCYSGSRETAEYCIKKGLYISFGGKLTYKNSKTMAEVAASVPIERILLETDAPYLTPSQKLGELNYPKYVAYVRDKLAELRGMTPEDVERVTADNARRLFGITL